MTITQSDIAARQQHVEAVRAWVKVAIEDGWEQKPTYKGESVERAATLHKEGFMAMAIMREPMGATGRQTGNRYPNAALNVWGPDKMAVKSTLPYDWEGLMCALHACQFCGKVFEGKAYHVKFADRACQTCGPVEQSKLPPNWAD